MIFSGFILILMLEGFQLLKIYRMETTFTPDAFFEFANLMMAERLKYAYFLKTKNINYIFYFNISFLKHCNSYSVPLNGSNVLLYDCQNSWIKNFYTPIEGDFKNITSYKRLSNNKVKVKGVKLHYTFWPWFIIEDISSNKIYNVSIFSPANIIASCTLSSLTNIQTFLYPYTAVKYILQGDSVVAVPYGFVNLLFVNRSGYLFKVTSGIMGCTHKKQYTKEIP